MNHMQTAVSQLTTFRRDGFRGLKMGTINILRTMRQLDGEYGCKAVRQKDKDGNEIVVLKKKNFFDRVLDILFDLKSSSVNRSETLVALDKIAVEISDAESGKFKLLLNEYKNSEKKIDFKEIKKTLAESLSWEFPPEVFFKKELTDTELISKVEEYKEFHIKNMRKSLILRKDSIPLSQGGSYANISDENIKGFVRAAKETFDRTDKVIKHEGNSQIEVRVELAKTESNMEISRSTTEEVKSRIKELKDRLEALRTFDENRKAAIERTWKKVYYKNLDKIYVKRLDEAVKNTSYQIEVMVEFDGGISAENIAALTKARVQREQSLSGKKFAVSIGERASGNHPDIEEKLCDAYVDYKNCQWK